jgi:Predicted solute binding protein
MLELSTFNSYNPSCTIDPFLSHVVGWVNNDPAEQYASCTSLYGFPVVSTETPEVNVVFETITTTVSDTTIVVELTTTETTVAETSTSYETLLQTLTVYTATVTSTAPHSYVTTVPWNGGAVVKRSETVPEQRLKRKRRRGCLRPTPTASSPFTASAGSSPSLINLTSSSISVSHAGTAPYWTNSTSSTYPTGTLSHWTNSAASSIPTYATQNVPYWTNSTSSTYPTGTFSHWATSATSSIPTYVTQESPYWTNSTFLTHPTGTSTQWSPSASNSLSTSIARNTLYWINSTSTTSSPPIGTVAYWTASASFSDSTRSSSYSTEYSSSYPTEFSFSSDVPKTFTESFPLSNAFESSSKVPATTVALTDSPEYYSACSCINAVESTSWVTAPTFTSTSTVYETVYTTATATSTSAVTVFVTTTIIQPMTTTLSIDVYADTPTTTTTTVWSTIYSASPTQTAGLMVASPKSLKGKYVQLDYSLNILTWRLTKSAELASSRKLIVSTDESTQPRLLGSSESKLWVDSGNSIRQLCWASDSSASKKGYRAVSCRADASTGALSCNVPSLGWKRMMQCNDYVYMISNSYKVPSNCNEIEVKINPWFS